MRNKAIGVAFLILCPSSIFGQKLTKEQLEAMKQPRKWAAIAARDGEATDFIYNYLFVGDDERSMKFDSVWYWACIKQPCHLFKKGEKVVISFPKGTQERRVRASGGKTEKHLVGELCGGSTECFEAAFVHSQKVENKQGDK